jgi:hypothetical protein
MDPQFVVLLHSKYSSNCKKLLQTIDQYGLKIDTLCVDNEKVRKRVVKSKNVPVKVVPCILLGFPGGTIEKYDGEHAFEWITKVIGNINSSKPQRPTQQGPPQPIQTYPPQQQPPQQQPMQQPQQPMRQSPQRGTSVDDLEYYEAPQQPQQPPQQQPMPPQQQPMPPQQQGPPQPDNEYFEEPPIEFRGGVGQNKPKPTKGPDGSSDIMAKAQEMQKMREAEADKSNQKRASGFPARR